MRQAYNKCICFQKALFPLVFKRQDSKKKNVKVLEIRRYMLYYLALTLSVKMLCL